MAIGNVQLANENQFDEVRICVEKSLVVNEETKPTDLIIRVNRSVPPSYPDWMKEVMHPELESTGPAEYDISEAEQWLHDGQKEEKWTEGNKIYAHLKKNDMLKTCLGLRDLEEIQKKGIALFREHFKGNVVFGWKGVVVVRNRYGDLGAPCLYGGGGAVVLNWYWLNFNWDGNNPALRLATLFISPRLFGWLGSFVIHRNLEVKKIMKRPWRRI